MQGLKSILISPMTNTQNKQETKQEHTCSRPQKCSVP